ncbi:MAG: XdhC family protein, partial [Chloroflexota bacterium]|nr:XdhC family protein [Chloroflexota bacterium]
MSIASFYDQVREAVAARVAVALATVIRGDGVGAKLLVLPRETQGRIGDDEVSRRIDERARELLRAEQSETITFDTDGGQIEVFIEVFPPAPTLLIFGAVHV